MEAASYPVAWRCARRTEGPRLRGWAARSSSGAGSLPSAQLQHPAGEERGREAGRRGRRGGGRGGGWAAGRERSRPAARMRLAGWRSPSPGAAEAGGCCFFPGRAAVRAQAPPRRAPPAPPARPRGLSPRRGAPPRLRGSRSLREPWSPGAFLEEEGCCAVPQLLQLRILSPRPVLRASEARCISAAAGSQRKRSCVGARESVKLSKFCSPKGSSCVKCPLSTPLPRRRTPFPKDSSRCSRARVFCAAQGPCTRSGAGVLSGKQMTRQEP